MKSLLLFLALACIAGAIYWAPVTILAPIALGTFALLFLLIVFTT